MIRALMVDDSTHQLGILELTIEKYTHRDGSQVKTTKAGRNELDMAGFELQA